MDASASNVSNSDMVALQKSNKNNKLIGVIYRNVAANI